VVVVAEVVVLLVAVVVVEASVGVVEDMVAATVAAPMPLEVASVVDVVDEAAHLAAMLRTELVLEDWSVGW
jgi:hypothetical protein